jgi:hypothetical protein
VRDGYNTLGEENDMRAVAFWLGLVLFVTLLAVPRAVYACPS